SSCLLCCRLQFPCLVLFGLYFNLAAAPAGNRARDINLLRFRNDFYNPEILDGNPLSAHATRHAHTFSHAASCASAASNGAGLTLGMLLAVRAASASETVPFNDALEAFSFRDTRNAHLFAFSERRVIQVPRIVRR